MKRCMKHYGITINQYITNEVDFALGQFVPTTYGTIHTGADKAGVIAQLNTTKVTWTMVGDLRSDVLSMVDANGGGIVVRDDNDEKVGRSAIKALSNLGIAVLSSTPAKGQVVWWTWPEIESWIDSMPKP